MTGGPDPEVLLRTLERLEPLVGAWSGRGQGRYPTIDSFEYEEELRFELHSAYPMLSYEQKTVLMSGAASHWETGFVRPVDSGVVELSNAQDSGRVEVLRGAVTEENAPWELRLRSVHLGHDPRMVATVRTLRIVDGHLEYEVLMSTQTTPEPELQVHLRAELTR